MKNILFLCLLLTPLFILLVFVVYYHPPLLHVMFVMALYLILIHGRWRNAVWEAYSYKTGKDA